MRVTFVDAKTAFDVLNSERLTSDRKIRIDAAVLQEAGPELCVLGAGRGDGERQPRQVARQRRPGECDGQGKWSLTDTEEAKLLREEAGCRKREYMLRRRL